MFFWNTEIVFSSDEDGGDEDIGNEDGKYGSDEDGDNSSSDSSDDDEGINKKGNVEIIFSDSDDDEKKEDFKKDHNGVYIKNNLELRKHQLDAVNWIHQIESYPRLDMTGGLLALKMGLGKTFSMLYKCMLDDVILEQEKIYLNTFVKSGSDITNLILQYKNPKRYPNLVVCSKTISYEWKGEIEKFFGSTCPYLFFHNS